MGVIIFLLVLLGISLSPIWGVVWLRKRQVKKGTVIGWHLETTTTIHYFASAIYFLYGIFWSIGIRHDYLAMGKVIIAFIVFLISVISYWFVWHAVKFYEKWKSGNFSGMQGILMLLLLTIYAPFSLFFFTSINVFDYHPEEYEIHGVIYDQEGHPVPGVAVAYQLWHQRYGRSIRHVTSDSNGHFYISGYQNAYLELLGADKDGYEFPRSEWNKGVYKNAIMEGNSPSGWKYYSESKPAVFHSWKRSADPELIASDVRLKVESGKDYFLNIGEVLSNDFAPRRVHQLWSSNALDVKPTDLILHIETDGGSSYASQNGWSLSLSAPDGGVIETKDLFMHKAPDGGWQESWKISFSKPRGKSTYHKGYESEMKRHFYIKSRNGGLYARLEMEVRPFYGNTEPTYSMVNLKYWSNIHGSTNLQTPNLVKSKIKVNSNPGLQFYVNIMAIFMFLGFVYLLVHRKLFHHDRD